MNAIELLKKDHKTVKSLFESFEKAKEREQASSKAEIFASIKEELDAHARVEEEIFYPAVDRAAEDDEDKELVLEAGEEHKQVKTLLAELAGLSPDDESFDAKVKVLQENVDHHVKEEEGEMFPSAQRHLGSDQLEELGARISTMKERLQQETTGQGASVQPSAGRARSQARTTSPRRRSGRKAKATPSGGRSSGGARSSGRSQSTSRGRSASGRSGSSSGRSRSLGRSQSSSRTASSASRARSSRSRGRSSGSRGKSSGGRGRSSRA